MTVVTPGGIASLRVKNRAVYETTSPIKYLSNAKAPLLAGLRAARGFDIVTLSTTF
ncbi:MAG TPA: hypothetical protein VII32_01220 [Thermoanaerobaculia bacterium]